MTAVASPAIRIQEFSIEPGGNERSTYYINKEGGDLRFKVLNQGDIEAAVVVLIDVDETFHEVSVDSRNLSEVEALTMAAAEILRVRDQILRLHGHASYENYLEN